MLDKLKKMVPGRVLKYDSANNPKPFMSPKKSDFQSKRNEDFGKAMNAALKATKKRGGKGWGV